MDKALLRCKSIEKINNQLYCLKEIESVNRYLIVGTSHALLFDTGYGYLDFKEQIKKITDLPVYVVNSHGHPDHGLGDYLFKNVYIHVNDYYQLLSFDNDSTTKLHTIKYRYKKLPELKNYINEQQYIKPGNLSHTKFHFIKDHDKFDLGNLSLEVIEIPGHTYGSIALFCPEKGWLFTGDSVCYYNIYYQMGLQLQAPWKVYIRSLNRLLNMNKQVSELYPAHGQKPIPLSAAKETKEAIFDLVKNYQDDRMIKTINKDAYAHYYKHTLILYSNEMVKEALHNGLDD